MVSLVINVNTFISRMADLMDQGFRTKIATIGHTGLAGSGTLVSPDVQPVALQCPDEQVEMKWHA